MSLSASVPSFPGGKWLKLTMAGLPLYIWARDSLFSIYQVQGTSMEPTLKSGDRVLVRKCDPGAIVESILDITAAMMTMMMVGVGDGNSSSSGSSSSSSNIDSRDTERARLVRYEKLQGVSDHVPPARLYQCPPLAMAGNIVVYKDPTTAFPSQCCVKRVVGIGGQWMTQSRRLVAIPPYHLYVEGDNLQNSQDSRDIGPISKNLMVGVAEYVVWPPSRWGKLERKQFKDQDGKLRAFWP